MPGTDRDVRLRVGIEREGETAAFREITEELGGTEEAAKAAATAASDLLDNLGNVNPSEFEDLKGALDGVRKSLKEIDQADTFAKQKTAVDGLEGSLETVAGVLSRAWKEGSAELERYERTLATVRDSQARFADPLVAQLRTADEAVVKLETSLSNGSRISAQALAAVGVQVRELAEELRQAEAAGRDVGRSGEALQQLEQRYESVTAAAAKMRGEEERVRRGLKDGAAAGEGYRRSIGSIGDVFQNLADKGSGLTSVLGKVGLAIGGVALAFTAGYRAGQKFVEIYDAVAKNLFNQETAWDRVSGAINRWIGLTAIANKIAGESGDLGLNQAKILESQRAAFERLGIDLSKYTSDLQANQSLIGEASRAHHDHADAVEETANAYKLLTDQQLVSRANQVLQEVSTLLKNFPREQVVEAVEGAVQDLLAQLDRLPPAVRGNVQAMADTLGILPPAHEEAAEAAEDHADRAEAAAKSAAAAEKREVDRRIQNLKRLKDTLLDLLITQEDAAAGPTGGGPPGDLKNAQDELEGLQDKPVNTLEELARIDELKDSIRELQREYGAAGEAAQDWGDTSALSATRIDQDIRGLVEQLGPSLSEISAGQQAAIQQILENLQAAGQQGVATSELFNQSIGQIAAVFDSAGGSAGGFRDVLDQVQGRGFDVARAFQEAAARQNELAASSQAVGPAVAAAGEAVAQGAAAAEAGSVSLERVGDKWRVVGDQAGESAISIRRAGEETEATSLRVQQSGEAAAQAGTSFSSLGAAAAGSSAGSSQAAEAALRAAGATGDLKTEIDTATISISRHSSEVAQAAAAEDQVGAAATAAGAAIAGQATSTDSAAGATDALAGAAESAAGAQDSLAGSTGAAAGAQDQLATAAGAAATAAEREVAAAERLKAALEGVAAVDLSPVFAQLQTLSAELEAAAAKAEEAGARINAALATDDSDPFSEVELIRSLPPS
jgi:hypothetical protein